ncbi:phosphatase RsbU N-terminal domain-containing protein [Blastococcus sp. URHD0036]|uniref:phosphatase RsbU N-terminal domain-containing protein n=1 Tax=Blastococcus sp. URHD0036 TaxID=1380356 RepID=UPI0004975757|nr:phosphatase RsbU N-terminal domain-containing protein [Blastococcus sp. URHD0036]
MNNLEALTRDYRVAFLGYLPRRGEAALSRGYELGRAAVTSGVSILELARVHHEVLLEALHETPPEELSDVATAASEFFLEVLATFDMAQRAFLDARGTTAPPVPDPRPESGVTALRPGAGHGRGQPGRLRGPG